MRFLDSLEEAFSVEHFSPEQIDQIGAVVAGMPAEVKPRVVEMLAIDPDQYDVRALMGVDAALLPHYVACLKATMTAEQREQFTKLNQAIGHDTGRLHDAGLGVNPDRKGWAVVDFVCFMDVTKRKSLINYFP